MGGGGFIFKWEDAPWGALVLIGGFEKNHWMGVGLPPMHPLPPLWETLGQAINCLQYLWKILYAQAIYCPHAKYSWKGLQVWIFFLAIQCSEQEILAAKIDEIEKWKENHVFEPIYYNGQKRILTRWVLPEKFVYRKKIIAKA